jgi:hypothetical protein
MKHINDIEVIIVSHHCSADGTELAKWMATKLQSLVKEQVKQTKDKFFGILSDAPEFYLT